MAEKLTYQITVEKSPTSDDTKAPGRKWYHSLLNGAGHDRSAMDQDIDEKVEIQRSGSNVEEKFSIKKSATKVEVLEDTPKKSDWNPSTPGRKWYQSLLTGTDHDRSAIDQDIEEKVEIQKSDTGSNVEENFSFKKYATKVEVAKDMPKKSDWKPSTPERKWYRSLLSGASHDRSDVDQDIDDNVDDKFKDGSAKKLTRRGATRRKPIIVEVGDDNENIQHSEKKITVQVVEQTVIASPDNADKSNKSKIKFKIDKDEKKKAMIEESTENDEDSQSTIRKLLCCCYTPTKSTEVKSTTKETEEAQEAATEPQVKTDKAIIGDKDEKKKAMIEESTEDEVDSQSKLRKLLCCCYTSTKSNEVKSTTKGTEEAKEATEAQVKPKWELKEEFRQVTHDKIYVKTA